MLAYSYVYLLYCIAVNIKLLECIIIETQIDVC